jgi:toxin YoeB
MTYTVIIKRKADSDIKTLTDSGDKVSLKKLKAILLELENTPKTGIGNPELLKYNLSGLWSRRINKKDRIIYEIIEEPERMVVVISALDHYWAQGR